MHLAERLTSALDRIEALLTLRDNQQNSEIARLKHIEQEARLALTEINTLLDRKD